MALSRGKLAGQGGKNIMFVPAGTAGTLYVNPAQTKTYFKGFVVFNGNTTTETVNLYLAEDNVGARP